MNAEQLTPQNAEQHRIAQEAGNSAYESVFDTSGKGRWNLRSATEAYQLAYQTSLSEQQGAPRPGYIVNHAAQMPEAQDAADEKMAEYNLTHMPLTSDSANDSLIMAANEHNVKAFEWRRTHPDWRTRR